MQLFGSCSGSVTLYVFGAAWLAACGSTTAPASTGSAVDSAYAALVGDVASCAKQVTSCVDGAADKAARDTCRTAFASCRESAGQNAAGALAGAVADCASRHDECVRSANAGAAGSCEDELNTCLRAAHPKSDDDADAGSDEETHEPSDCLDELHTCVNANRPANSCADSVRMCVVDSVPNPDDVVPSDDADDHGDKSDDESDDDSSGAGPGTPAQVGSSRSEHADDAGVQDKKSAARVCVDAFRSCIDSGSAARTCAQALKDCAH